MPDRRDRTALAILCILCLLSPAVALLAGTEVPARFADLFLEGDDETIDAMMSGQMRTAFSRAQRDQIRSGLRQNGALLRLGEAWLEGKLQGYDRYRVPVVFEKATLDFRVVVDGGGKVAGFFIVPHVAREVMEAQESPHREVEVEVGEPETALPGVLTLPDAPEPFPAVVLVHGSGPNDKDETLGPNKPFRDIAWGLAERGVAVLRYDKRSFARPQDLAALGAELSVEDEVVRDAHLALALLRERREIDGDRLYVLGHSLGGTLAPWIATTAEPRPAGVLVLAGATLPLPEKMLEQVRYIAASDGELSDEETRRIAQVEAAVKAVRGALEGKTPAPSTPILGAPLAYYRDLERHDPPAEAAGLGLPVFVLQGERDYQVTREDFARWREALEGRPGACLRAYEGLDHLFRHGTGPSTPQDYERAAPVAAEVLDDVAAWIHEGSCRGAGL